MKKSFLLCFALVLLSFTSTGQIAHDLEIYSEDGLLFTLVINGRTMNDKPVSNIQITNTDKDYVNAKIIFEDTSIATIEKKMLQIATPGTQEKVPVSVVYKIVTKKDEVKLVFASRSEKKIQQQTDVIIRDNSSPSNGRIIINW